MPSNARREKDKKISLIKSAKNCNKITSLFKKTNSSLGASILTDIQSHSEIIINVAAPKVVKQREEVQQVDISVNKDLSEYLNDFSNVFQNKSLSDSNIHKILKHNYSIEENYQFKKQLNDRIFLRTWLKEYEWLIYSKKLEGAFCKYCVLFARTSERINFVNQPKTKKWKHASTEFRSHNSSTIHQECAIKAENFILTYENKIDSIDAAVNKHLKEDQVRTRNGLIQIVKTLMLCARQNIPLRGHSDNNIIRINDFGTSCGKNDDGKLGNFNSLLMFRLDAGDEMLKEHFEKSKRMQFIQLTVLKIAYLEYRDNSFSGKLLKKFKQQNISAY